MKIDKTNIVHWVLLALFGANVICAIVLRVFRRHRSARQVVLYGHKLTGNLLAIYRAIRESPQSNINVAFLTMDQKYHRELIASGKSSVLATALACMHLLRMTDAVISDHGLHAMSPMLWLSDVKFFDVWHGIPFKGFDAADFRVQRHYDECWVASPLLARMYVDRYGFDADKVKATGYPRTDRLVRRDEEVSAIKRGLGLDGPGIGKIVLFAPTWAQDVRQRNIFPFGNDEQMFLQALSALAQRTGSTFVLRKHLNSGAGTDRDWDRIVCRPYTAFPDTEELLLVSNILVCDWSSIAFDFLLLARPAIFLDVEPPFAKGFSLDASYRFGAIAKSMDELLQLLERYLFQPGAYDEEFAVHAAEIREAIYGNCADGDATDRCVERLRENLRPMPGNWPSRSAC